MAEQKAKTIFQKPGESVKFVPKFEEGFETWKRWDETQRRKVDSEKGVKGAHRVYVLSVYRADGEEIGPGWLQMTARDNDAFQNAIKTAKAFGIEDVRELVFERKRDGEGKNTKYNYTPLPNETLPDGYEAYKPANDDNAEAQDTEPAASAATTSLDLGSGAEEAPATDDFSLSEEEKNFLQEHDGAEVSKNGLARALFEQKLTSYERAVEIAAHVVKGTPNKPIIRLSEWL